MLGVIRRNPTLGLTSFGDTLFDNFLNGFFDEARSPSTSTNLLIMPTIDVYREEDGMTGIRMEVPGYDRDDIQMNVSGGVLEIRGERTEREEHKDKKRSYLVRESASSFARRIVLPEGANTEKISAELDKGVLKVMVPVEQAEAKKIEIAAPNSKGKARLASITRSKSDTKLGDK